MVYEIETSLERDMVHKTDLSFDHYHHIFLGEQVRQEITPF